MDIRSWALEMGFDEAEAIPAAMLPRAQELLPGARTLWILVTAHRPFDPGDWPEDGLVVASHYPASQQAYHRTRRLAPKRRRFLPVLGGWAGRICCTIRGMGPMSACIFC